MVKQGELALVAEKPVPPVWALTIDGRPVLAFPVKAGDDVVDLGEIVTSAEGLGLSGLPRRRGRVFGVPGRCWT